MSMTTQVVLIVRDRYERSYIYKVQMGLAGADTLVRPLAHDYTSYWPMSV